MATETGSTVVEMRCIEDIKEGWVSSYIPKSVAKRTRVGRLFEESVASRTITDTDRRRHGVRVWVNGVFMSDFQRIEDCASHLKIHRATIWRALKAGGDYGDLHFARIADEEMEDLEDLFDV